MMDDVAQDFFRCFKTKRCRVADVELEHLVAFFLKPLGFLQHRSTNVIADIVQFAGFGEDPRFTGRQRGDFWIRGFHECSAGLAQLRGWA